jgi:succinoglycan biosynthesis transport protein ExoP
VLPEDADLPNTGSRLPDDVPAGPAEQSDLLPVPNGAANGEVLQRERSNWAQELPPAPGLASGPDTRTILNGLRRRWYVALFLGLLLGGGAAAAAYYLLEPKFTAVAEVRVASTPPWLLSPHVDTPEGRAEFLSYLQLQVASLKSRDVLNAARKRPEVKSLDIIKNQLDQIAYLDEEVKVEAKENSEIIKLYMSGMNPDDLRTIVQGVREAYFEEVVARDRLRRQARAKELKEIYNDANSSHKRKLEELHREADLLGTTESGTLMQKQLNLVTTLGEKKRQLAQVQFDLMKADAKLKAQQGHENPEVTVTQGDLEQAKEADSTTKRLQQRHDILQEVISQYEATSRLPNEPGLVRARDQLQDTNKALEARKAELKKLVAEALRNKGKQETQATNERLQAEMVPLAQQVKDLDEEVKNLSAEADKFGKSSTTLEQLRDEVANEKKHKERYEDELAKLEIELRPGVPPRVTKFQEEAFLQKRETRRQLMATAAAPVLMMVLCCFGVGWWECRARRICTTEEVITGLGMRLVGALPALSQPGKRLLAEGTEQDLQEHRLLESIDAIRTLLLRDADVSAMRVVMVTSAVGGEGKTTLASHLAGSMARAGRRTLLIDCDLRRPAAHQLFELPLQPGLSEALLGEVHVAEATLATGVDGLWMMPAGQWDREVIQSLAREGLRQIFDKLRHDYDFIVIDSHPVLPATDSLLIGQHVDAVLLSVMREVSRAPKVYAACQRLNALGIRVLGAVVNGVAGDDVHAHGGQYAAMT